jgi:hypothetical protein
MKAGMFIRGDYQASRNEILTLKVTPKFGMKLLKTFELLDQEAARCEKLHKDIVRRYQEKDAQGNLKWGDNGGPLIPSHLTGILKEELAELENTEVDLNDVPKLSMTALEAALKLEPGKEFTLSGFVMRTLVDVIIIDEGPEK